MTQILFGLAKQDEEVQGYQQESRMVAEMSNNNAVKCFSAVDMLAKHYAIVASRLVYGTNGAPLLENASGQLPPRHRRPRPLLNLGRRHLRRPWARHLVPPVVVVSFLFSDRQSGDFIYHPTACADSGWPKGGDEKHKHTYHEEPLTSS